MKKIYKLKDELIIFFNIVIGVISFNLGMSCLNTSHPSRYAILSLVFVFLLIYVSSKYEPFSKAFAILRKSRAKKDGEMLQQFDEEVSSVKYFVTELGAYVLGMGFLGFIALGIVK